MSLYIKGMPMPNEKDFPFELFFRCTNYTDMKLVIRKDGKEQVYDLVEVPEPHGRLADIEDVKKAIFDYHGEDEQKVRTMINAILSTVPTVVEAEGDDYDYERASDMRDYCEIYEPTYNTEDGSM